MNQLSNPFYITTLLAGVRLFTSIYAFIIFFISFKYKKHIPIFKYLKNFALSFAFWDLFRSIFYFYRGTELLPLLWSFVYFAVPFASVTFFHLCFAYTFPQLLKKNKWISCIYIVPFITVIMVAIPPFNNFFITFTSEIEFIPYRSTKEYHHFWYYFYIVYNIILTSLGVVLLGIKLKTVRKDEKQRCILITIAALLFISLNMYRNLITSSNGFWLSPILSTASLTLIFLTFYYNEDIITISTGRDKLLDSLLFPIFLLDKNNGVVYANQVGQELFGKDKILRSRDFSRADIFDLFSVYASYDTLISLAEKNHKYIVLQNKVSGQIYYCQEKFIVHGTKNKVDGKILLFFTIDSMAKMFSSLKDKAYRDLLCGCYNRHYWEERKKQQIQESELPLTCFVFDVDNLKYVNDTFGHDSGDDYIFLSYSEIIKHFPSTNQCIRMGGDEFLLILQNCTFEQSQGIYKKIKEGFASHKTREGYTPSVSIGYATATKLPVDWNSLIQEADDAMYADKKLNKSRKGDAVVISTDTK